VAEKFSLRVSALDWGFTSMGTIIPFKPPFLPKLPSARLLFQFVICAAMLCGALGFVTQTSATTPPHKQLHSHEHLSAVHPQTPQAAPAPVLPPAPELPHWPVNEKPTQASVLYDSHGLRISAQNSSLQQILQDVAAATGAKVEGMGADERVFGVYGPGQVRDVLSQLLEGSGYNVLLIGDQGQGTPRQIVLSTRPTEPAPTAIKSVQANARKEDADAGDEPSLPDVNPGTDALPHTPQQLMQEIQQRRQAQQQPPPQN
jgi:hypothetical protein